VPDDRDRERPAEQGAVRLDQGQEEDDEAPEDQEVRDSRHRPAEQLALPEDLGELRLRTPARMLAERGDPLRRRLAGPGQPVEPPQPPARDDESGRGDDQPDDDAHGHRVSPHAAAVRAAAGPAPRHRVVPA
jgi:hypothetical protein